MSKYLNGLRTTNAYTKLKDNSRSALKKIPVVGERVVHHLSNTKSGIKQLFVSGMLFENMGITYLGPVDGHNLEELIKALNQAKRVKQGVLLHVITHKGLGYQPAFDNPAKFHGTEPFDIATGEILSSYDNDSYTEVFSKVLTDEASRHKNLVAVTAAMGDGTGLDRFARHFPKRFFDVGIAEEHAVTFAAGLAAGGLKPVVAIYSSFLQRGYDQIIHDVCLQDLPVVFAIDRAGLVGSDGETHQGLFDLSFLSSIPGMTVMAPKNRWELADMVRFAIDYNGPIALRYPRGAAYEGFKSFRSPIVYGKSEVIYEEDGIGIIFVGNMGELADEVRKELKEIGYHCSLINARFIKPLDAELIEELDKSHKLIVSIEENLLSGGYGHHVRSFIEDAKLGMKVRSIGINDEYIEHGSVELLRKEVGIDKETIVKKIISDYVVM
jgi:1-deoxy-D-xylulose-5-phosphate synthase